MNTYRTKLPSANYPFNVKELSSFSAIFARSCVIKYNRRYSIQLFIVHAAFSLLFGHIGFNFNGWEAPADHPAGSNVRHSRPCFINFSIALSFLSLALNLNAFFFNCLL